MSEPKFQTWRGPGCGEGCIPRRHDPTDHERYGHENGYAQAVEDMHPRNVSVGCLTVDLIAKAVTVNDERVPLTDREYTVLAYLASNVGRWCRTRDVEDAIWGKSPTNTGHNVRVNLSRLRPKLGPAAALIECGSFGQGYLLRHSQHDVFALPVRGAS